MKTIPSNRKRIALLAAIGWLPSFLCAQSPLDSYVHLGLKSNLALKEKEISLDQAKLSLDMARSYFLPSVNVLGDYTSGKGGRNIAIPIGDLLNPVYTTLNQLTESDAFPQVENVSQDFFPYNFYDVRVRTTVPLINTDLHINRNIEKHKVELQQYELSAYKRQLVFDIKVAYYNYLSARESEKIYESALQLVEKNVQVNESSMRNGANLPANVLRAKSESENVRAELNNARVKVINARNYLNFLLNRPLDADVDVAEDTQYHEVDEPRSDLVAAREELAMISKSREIQVSSLQMHKLSRMPKVNAFLDLGAQGADWEFYDRSKYFLFGVQLSIPVFQGFRNNLAIKQSRLTLERTDMQLQHTRARLEVAATMASNALLVAKQNFQAAQEQLKSSRSYFNLVEKGFRQGVNSQIEFIDARNQLTQSELTVNLRQFEMLIAAAQLERETSSFIFN
jgi:outer membrane protein